MSEYYIFALLNNWEKEREKYPRPNPYDEESEVDENDVDVDIESDEDMIELEAEVMSEEEDDEFDEREKMILEFKNEMDYKFVGNNDMNDVDVVDEIKSDSDEKVYSSYFTEKMIAKLYSMDKVHDKDSIEYGIPDNRYWTYDSCESYLRDGSDEEDYIEDSESDEKAGNKMKKKGCFAFLSRVFNRLFKKN